jgi:hypothetical protein
MTGCSRSGCKLPYRTTHHPSPFWCFVLRAKVPRVSCLGPHGFLSLYILSGGRGFGGGPQRKFFDPTPVQANDSLVSIGLSGHRHIKGLDIPLTKLKKYQSHLGVVMQLSNEVHNFARYCERLLSTVAVIRPLTEEEMRLVEYYCRELLTKVGTLQSNPQEISHSRNAHRSPDHSTSS